MTPGERTSTLPHMQGLALVLLLVASQSAAQVLSQADGQVAGTDQQAAVDGSCLAYQSSLSANLTQAVAHLVGSLPPGTANPITFEYLTAQMAQLLGTCTRKPAMPVRMVNVLSATETAAIFTPVAKMVEQLSGFKMALTFIKYSASYDETMFQLDNSLNMTDVWTFDSSAIIDMAESAGGFGFVDLKPFIDSDDTLLNWQDVHPFFRQVSAVYKGQYIGLPLSAFSSYLFYRRDVFRQYNLSVPVTWDEYRQLAKQLNGTDFNGDGKPDWSVCLASSFKNEILTFTGTVAPTLLLTSPTQGLLWDTLTMKSLVDSPAFGETMDIFQDILNYAPPMSFDDDRTSAGLADFTQCAFGVFTAELFKSSWQWPKIRGQIGTAMVPGSTRVLDRNTMQLVPCRPDLCSDTAVDAQGNTISVNRAPFSGMSSISMGMNPHSAQAFRPAIWRVMAAFMAAPIQAKLYVYNPLAPFGPIRISQMALTPENLAAWTKAGYNLNDTKDFLTVTQAVLSHPNRVRDMAAPSMRAYFNTQWEEMVAFLMGRQTKAVTLANIYRRFQAISAAIGQPERFAASYREFLRFQMPTHQATAAPTAAPESLNGGRLEEVLVPAIVVPASFLMALGAAAVIVIYHARKARANHRRFLGRAVIPPKPGPRTTLLVTDVEGSTALFEAIPQAMDIALGVHNSIMTAVLDKHSGYPSASEGDGWVMAFHTPYHAFSAAAELQSALLQADWPAELLQQASCAPTWVAPVPGGPVPPALWAALTKSLAQREGSSLGMHQLLACSVAGREASFAGARRASVDFTSRNISSLKLHKHLSSSAKSFSMADTSRLDLRKSTTGDGVVDTLESSSFAFINPRGSSSRIGTAELHSSCEQGDVWEMAWLAQGPFIGNSLFEFWTSAFQKRASPGLAANRRVSTLQSDMSTVATHHTVLSFSQDAHHQHALDADEAAFQELIRSDPDGDLIISERLPVSAFEQPEQLGVEGSTVGLDTEAGHILTEHFPELSMKASFSMRLRGARSVLSYGFNSSRLPQVGTRAEKKTGISNQLVARGLKVRMGLHSGLHSASDVVINKTTGRHQYGGELLAAAKSVCDAAHGDMILASQEAFQQASWSSLSTHMAVLSVGEHVLKASSGLQSTTRVLYEVIPHALALRAAVRPPQLRSITCKQPGYSVAPCGTVAVGYFQAVGIPALISWDPDATHKSLKLMHSVATSLLPLFGGYLLDLSEALGILAAFSSSADAIRWALVLQRALMHADWPSELLDHPLGEELAVTSIMSKPAQDSSDRPRVNTTPPSPDLGVLQSSPFKAEEAAADRTVFGLPSPRHVKFAPDEPSEMSDRCSTFSLIGKDSHSDVVRVTWLRGLRTKCGIDVGEVRSTINELSGRITYVGKVMNRAARITQATKSGQVWCSSAAWDATSSSSHITRIPSYKLSASKQFEENAPGSLQRKSSRAEIEHLGDEHLERTRDNLMGQATGGSLAPDFLLTTRLSLAAQHHEQDVKPGIFGTVTDDLPVREVAKHRACSISSSAGSVNAEDEMSESVTQALQAASELSRINVNAVSLGPQKLKSLQEALTLVKCELDQMSLVVHEARHRC